MKLDRHVAQAVIVEDSTALPNARLCVSLVKYACPRKKPMPQEAQNPSSRKAL